MLCLLLLTAIFPPKDQKTYILYILRSILRSIEWLLYEIHVLYQTWDAVFHHQMKHQEESWKYDARRSIFDELRGVSSGDETLCRMFDINFFSNKIIFEGEIKDAKMSSFSSDIQTFIKHQFPLNFLYELLMSLRSSECNIMKSWDDVVVDRK